MCVRLLETCALFAVGEAFGCAALHILVGTELGWERLPSIWKGLLLA